MNRAMAEVQEFSDSASRRQKWVLTKEAFDTLLAALDSDSDLAGEKYLFVFGVSATKERMIKEWT